MQISDDQIDEFMKSWEIAFNERLTREEARAKAAELSELFSRLSGQRPSGGPASSPAEDG